MSIKQLCSYNHVQLFHLLYKICFHVTSVVRTYRAIIWLPEKHSKSLCWQTCKSWHCPYIVFLAWLSHSRHVPLLEHTTLKLQEMHHPSLCPPRKLNSYFKIQYKCYIFREGLRMLQSSWSFHYFSIAL